MVGVPIDPKMTLDMGIVGEDHALLVRQVCADIMRTSGKNTSRSVVLQI